MEILLGFTLFGSAIVFYIALAVLLFILIGSELEESGTTATIAFLCFLGFNYLWGNLPILEIITLKNIAIYLGIGFIFAIIRTYFKGRELTPENRKTYKLKEAVFRWWFLWPISTINWVYGKLLKDFYNFAYSKFQKFFEFIFNA